MKVTVHAEGTRQEIAKALLEHAVVYHPGITDGKTTGGKVNGKKIAAAPVEEEENLDELEASEETTEEETLDYTDADEIPSDEELEAAGVNDVEVDDTPPPAKKSATAGTKKSSNTSGATSPKGATKITASDVQAMLAKFAAKGAKQREAAKALVKKFKVDHVSKLPSSAFAEVQKLTSGK